MRGERLSGAYVFNIFNIALIRNSLIISLNMIILLSFSTDLASFHAYLATTQVSSLNVLPAKHMNDHMNLHCLLNKLAPKEDIES